VRVEIQVTCQVVAWHAGGMFARTDALSLPAGACLPGALAAALFCLAAGARS